MRRNRTAIEVLLEVTESLTEAMPLEEVLTKITDAFLELVPCNHTSIRVFDDTRSELISGARSGEGSSTRPPRFMKGEGIAGWVADYGRVARVGDVRTDSRFKPLGGQGFDFSSILAVPIAIGDDVIGVLAATAAEPNSFQAEHETLARLLANCCVPVIQRNRLLLLGRSDPLTGALRACLILPRLEHAVERAARSETPLSLVLVELQGVQKLYAERGCTAGDQALRIAGDRLRDLGLPGHLVFAQGGSIFAILMPETDSAAAGAHSRAIARDFALRPVETTECAVKLSVHVGVVGWDRRESAKLLVHRAENALAHSREGGADRITIQ